MCLGGDNIVRRCFLQGSYGSSLFETGTYSWLTLLPPPPPHHHRHQCHHHHHQYHNHITIPKRCWEYQSRAIELITRAILKLSTIFYTNLVRGYKKLIPFNPNKFIFNIMWPLRYEVHRRRNFFCHVRYF